MTPEIARLLEIQERDREIHTLETELARLPEERKLRETQLAGAAAKLERAKTRFREIEVEKKNLEVEIAAKKTSIDRYKNQQLQTRKNEEYSALAHEIEASQKAISALEDRELDLMEEAEALQPEIAAAESAHKEEQAKIQKALEALAARAPNLQTRIAEVAAARKKAADGFDENLLDTYQRLFKAKSGSALVPLQHDVCTGCHMKVTSQTSVEVRSGKSLVGCPNCGRLLYLGEDDCG